MKELAIPLLTDSRLPLYEQIYSAVRAAILDGRIKKDERLPSTRFQAEYLQVSRSTVETAYAQLLAEGYIYAEPYRGYFVCDVSDLYQLSGRKSSAGMERWNAGADVPEQEEKADLLHPARHPVSADRKNESPLPVMDFSPNGIDTEQFPYASFGKILKNLMLDEGGELLDAGPSFGDMHLRTMICDYLYRSRSVHCRPEQIVLGAGNEFLLILLSQILGKDRIAAMESPTYLQAYHTFRNLGYTVAEIPMDKEGMSSRELGLSGADLAYVMPSHQFPLGTVMPLKRRLELLSWANGKPDRYLIEDDYDSEFRYRGKPVPALQGMDREGKVIYLGTFSRSIAPSVRVSYMVLPPELADACRSRCGFYSCTVSNIMQHAICEFMETGLFEKNLNRMRRIYRAKHDFLLNELKQRTWVKDIIGENAGLHLLAEIDTDKPEKVLISRLGEQRIRVYGISEYYISRFSGFDRPVLLLGYGGLTTQQMKEALEKMEDIICRP